MSIDFKDSAKRFGANVVKLRKTKKLTQEQLADEAGIERSYMGAIERGERNPTLRKVYQISNALKIKASDLFT